MEKAPADKMIHVAPESKEEQPTAVLEYFYPDHQITVRATNQQDADEALAKILAGATIKT